MLQNPDEGCVVVPRQHVVALAALEEVDAVKVVALLVYVFLSRGDTRPQQRTDPGEELRRPVLEEDDFIVEWLVDLHSQLLAEVVRQLIHKVRDALDVLDVIRLQVLANLDVQLMFEVVLFVQLFEDFHLAVKHVVYLSLCLDVARERAATIGEPDDADEHHKNVYNFLSERLGRKVAIPNGGDRCDRQVETRVTVGGAGAALGERGRTPYEDRPGAAAAEQAVNRQTGVVGGKKFGAVLYSQMQRARDD